MSRLAERRRMIMNNVQPPPSYRLPIGQKVTITSPFNAACAPIGTTGTIVELPAEFAVGSLTADDFWERWDEQFVALDGNVSSDGLPACIRRGHMAPVPDNEQRRSALVAMSTISFRLEPTTKRVLDSLLRGEVPTDDDRTVVEADCNHVWNASGRRKFATKRLAAHEAVEHFLRDDFKLAEEAARYAMPRKKP
jgi:hypothetical protein